MRKVSLVTGGNVSQFGTNRSKEMFWHRRVWNELGFGRTHIGFYFTITSSPPRQNFISLAVTQEATVNWNLSSMLLQYLGSYYPLGPRSLSPVLKIVLIWEDVFCGGKNAILLRKLFINFICLFIYWILDFCVYVWGKMLYCKSLSDIWHYVSLILICPGISVCYSYSYSISMHTLNKESWKVRMDWQLTEIDCFSLTHTHTVEGCARGAAEMSVLWLKLHGLCRVISQSLTV